MSRILKKILGSWGLQTPHWIIINCTSKKKGLKSFNNILAVEDSEVVPRIEKGHHPALIIVWWCILYDEITDLQFYEKGVKA